MIGAKPGEGPELETFTVDQFAAYLERHQRAAPSLLAVWNLTKDQAVLREALEKFPGDPAVVLQAFQHLDFPDEEKQALAARLEQEHPHNPLGSVLAGSQLAKAGSHAEAIAKLREVVSRGPLNLEIKSQQLAQREALMSLGKSPLEAQVWGLLNGSNVAPMLLSRDLARPAAHEIKNLLAGNDVDGALHLAGEMMALAKKITTEPGGGTLAELVSSSLEAGALHDLPQEVEIGDTGLTAAERMAQLKEKKDSISQLVDAVPWHLYHLDEPGLDLYLQILEHRGEREAVKWAEAYHGPAPKK